MLCERLLVKTFSQTKRKSDFFFFFFIFIQISMDWIGLDFFRFLFQKSLLKEQAQRKNKGFEYLKSSKTESKTLLVLAKVKKSRNQSPSVNKVIEVKAVSIIKILLLIIVITTSQLSHKYIMGFFKFYLK